MIDGDNYPESKFSKFKKLPKIVRAVRMDEPFTVTTLEGVVQGEAGDYLMIGVEGERYPCRASIFAESYEAVAQEET